MVLCAIYIDYNYDNDEIDYNEIRRLHKENLDKSPFKNTKQLSKSERKDLQLPPNPYNERLWELTMDPVLEDQEVRTFIRFKTSYTKSRLMKFLACQVKIQIWLGFQEDRPI